MSTSLNVVSMAAVFCASFSRRAIVWRSLVMRTRSSRDASSDAEGARAWAGADGAVAEPVGAPCAMAASMSPFVTRPSLPLPATLPGATPDSAFGASAALALAEADASAPWTMEPKSAPGVTVSPSLAEMSPSVPAAGALTSRVTLSVSSSTSGSSALTASPGFFNQRPIVASLTDSPRVGTQISVAMAILQTRKDIAWGSVHPAPSRAPAHNAFVLHQPPRAISHQPARAWLIPLQASTSPCTEATDFSNIAFSSPENETSTMRSTPPAPMTIGTPTYMSFTPY